MKKPLKQFRLKREYFTSVMCNEDMILSDLDGKIIFQGTSREFKDHPEFAKLRNKLEKQGFISIQRSWWNGDKVLMPFKLNQLSFNKGDSFLCADAIKIKTLSIL